MFFFSLLQYNFAIVTNGRPNYISEGATINIFDLRPSSNASKFQSLYLTLRFTALFFRILWKRSVWLINHFLGTNIQSLRFSWLNVETNKNHLYLCVYFPVFPINFID